MVAPVDPVATPKDEAIAGLTISAMDSVRIDAGGSAKCSANPLTGAVWVRTAFPSPGESAYEGRSFRIVTLRPKPVERQTPACALDDGEPDPFFGGSTYTSDIVIADILGGPFIRPDGDFWLKLDTDRWLRFRRDMTSDARPAAPRFLILSKEAFDTLVTRSTTFGQLAEALRARVPAGSGPEAGKAATP
ncbi:hypothetical protein [Methylobacterium sp. GC_Met_2]|uniref:hypothetical protein n=1 Tax=Methylobacterium sp. GC_Met_2 TaxID=2937376 RepID=UPI00226B0895|nr:hypothetical protein [Methylobacterium sp. GC_Met_2]